MKVKPSILPQHLLQFYDSNLIEHYPLFCLYHILSDRCVSVREENIVNKHSESVVQL